MLVYLNGEFVSREQAAVPVEDRGFLFGDGVYEVIRAVNGRFFTAHEHLARMEEGLAAIGMRLPGGMTRQGVLEIAERLLRENSLTEGHATIYLQVTRGAAPRTHFFPSPPVEPTLYLTAAPFTVPEEVVARGVSAITAPDVRWSRCNLKTLNLLANVLAKQSAVEQGATEAIFVRDGVITEGASTNVFVVVDGKIRTFPVCNYILSGVTRGVVIELAAELGIPLIERPVRVEEISRAEEIFLTGTTTDVLAVVEVDGLQVGTGRPGAISTALGGALAERMGQVPASAAR
jgi:D-alanine transaminase